MTATSKSLGHPICYDTDLHKWVPHTSHPDYDAEVWRCRSCKQLPTILKIGGKARQIDTCIAPIVKALNEGGIRTKACCCGHGKGMGDIALEDGRELLIVDSFEEARDLEKIIFEYLDNKEEDNV